MQATLDHLVVTADRLERGVAQVERALDLTMSGGGAHPVMGTHNRLLSLGPADYLEVIAVDPDAPQPDRARWFDLDRQAPGAALTHWALRVDDLDAALARAPHGAGEPVALTRGAYSWRMAVAQDGRLPFDGLFPGLIAWNGAHPAPALSETGARLVALELTHPKADALRRALAPLVQDRRLIVRAGPVKITAQIDVGGKTVTLA